jgi:hypothetical protein
VRKKIKWELKARSRNRKSKFKQHTGTNTGTDQKIIEIRQGQSSMKQKPGIGTQYTGSQTYHKF